MAKRSFVPMEAIGEDWTLDLSRSRSVGEVLTGYSYFEDGDIAFAKVTPCFENGKAAIMRGLTAGEGFGTTELTVVRPRRGVSAEFLFYVLNEDRFKQLGVAEMTGAGGLKRVPDRVVRDFEVDLPTRAEQDVIVSFLDRETAEIDAFIADQEKLIGLLIERRAATIQNVYDKAVERRPLRNLISLAQTGPFGTQLSATEYVTGGTPVINPTHIHHFEVRDDPDVSVTLEKALELRRFALDIGDIVLARKGEVDKSALIGAAHMGSICGSDSILIRSGRQTNPRYLWWFLQSPGAHGQLTRWSVGSTVAGLNQTTITQLRVPFGDAAFQERCIRALDSHVGELDATIADAREAIALSKERRAALISAAVTGKIDVRAVA